MAAIPSSPTPRNWKWKVKSMVKERQKLIRDFIRTESEYVGELKVLHDFLVLPILCDRKLKVVDNPGVVLFLTTLGQVYSLHSEVVKQFQNAADSGSSDVCVGEVFMQLALVVQYYEKYFANMTVAINEFQSTKDSRLTQILSEANEKKPSKVESLRQFLERPIKRSCEYREVIQNLLKFTPEGHPDECLLQETEDSVVNIGCNLFEKDNEDIKALLDLQKQFRSNPCFAIPGRELILSSVLHRVCRRGVKEFTFHLFSDVLTWSSKSLSGFYVRGRLRLLRASIRPIENTSKYSHIFEVSTHSKSVIIQCRSQDEKSQWLSAIQELLDARALEASMSSPSPKLRKSRSTSRSMSSAGLDGKEPELHNCNACCFTIGIVLQGNYCFSWCEVSCPSLLIRL